MIYGAETSFMIKCYKWNSGWKIKFQKYRIAKKKRQIIIRQHLGVHPLNNDIDDLRLKR